MIKIRGEEGRQNEPGKTTATSFFLYTKKGRVGNYILPRLRTKTARCDVFHKNKCCMSCTCLELTKGCSINRAERPLHPSYQELVSVIFGRCTQFSESIQQGPTQQDLFGKSVACDAKRTSHCRWKCQMFCLETGSPFLHQALTLKAVYNQGHSIVNEFSGALDKTKSLP